MGTVRVGQLCGLGVALLAACGGGEATGDGDRPGRAVELALESPAVLTLGLEDSARVIVRITERAGGAPVAGRPVRLSLSGSSRGAWLPQSRVTTGADGRAEAWVDSGPDRAGPFTLTVSTPQADGAGADPEARVTVAVDGVYHGRLQVRYSLGEPVDVAQLRTRLHASLGSCDEVRWPTQPAGDVELGAAGLAETTTFDSVPEGRVYRVTAVAFGVGGQPVAVGCAAAPKIVGRSSVTVTLVLHLRPPVLAGRYDFGADLDLGAALPATAASVAATLTALLGDPAGFTAGQLVEQLASRLHLPAAAVQRALELAWVMAACPSGGSCVLDADGDGSLLDDAVQSILFDRLYEQAPALEDAVVAAGDLSALLSHLRVGGVLEVDAPSAAGDVTARWDFRELLLRWRLGASCDPASACCGQRVVSMGSLPVGAAGAELSGRLTRAPVANRLEYELSLPARTLALRWGALLVYLVDELVLPALVGEDSVKCALERWMGCELDARDYVCCDGATAGCRPTSAAGAAVGDVCGCERAAVRLHDWLGGALGGLSLSPAVLADVCDLSLLGAQAALTDLVARLAVDEVGGGSLELGLSGTLADVDRDLTADTLAGRATGHLLVSGGPTGAALTGAVVGAREAAACSADADCKAWEACAPAPHPLDGCAVGGVCVPHVGTLPGGTPCSAGGQCRSGRCLTDHTCLELCRGDGDCSGGARCESGSVPVVGSVTSAVYSGGVCQ